MSLKIFMFTYSFGLFLLLFGSLFEVTLKLGDIVVLGGFGSWGITTNLLHGQLAEGGESLWAELVDN